MIENIKLMEKLAGLINKKQKCDCVSCSNCAMKFKDYCIGAIIEDTLYELNKKKEKL